LLTFSRIIALICAKWPANDSQWTIPSQTFKCHLEPEVKLSILLLSPILLLASCSTQPDNLALISDYQNQKNGHDLESTLSMFAEDARLNFGPLGSLVGADQIRAIHEYDLALDTKIVFEDCQAKDQEVSCLAIETNKWLDLVDIEFITYDESRFMFDANGRIESISATLSPASSKVLGEAMATFDVWARSNRADEYSALFLPDGNFSYSFENGENVLALLRRWRAN